MCLWNDTRIIWEIRVDILSQITPKNQTLWMTATPMYG